VYDSGCFHHIAPHPRITDLEVVTSGDTAGGMTFSLDDLRTIFAPLEPRDIRPVHPGRDDTFTADFLNAALFAAN